MDIGFIWDDEKYQEVQRRHNVQLYEVVSAFDDPEAYILPDPQGNEDRSMFVGKTVNDRLLVVIYSDEDAPLYRLITAFDAKGEVLNEYYKRSRI